MTNNKDKDAVQEDLTWLGIRPGQTSQTFEYVCSLEDRQLSGGLVPGAVDRRKKDKTCGLGACANECAQNYN